MKSLYPFILLTLMFFEGCTQSAEKEAFYLPKDYEGAVAVIFKQQNGIDKEYKNGCRIYRIPKTGVLYTQFDPVTGFLDLEFYYVDSTGVEIDRLPQLLLPVLPTVEVDSAKIYAMVGIDGKFGDQEYIYFFVGRAEKSDSLRKVGYRLMEQVREVYPEQIK